MNHSWQRTIATTTACATALVGTLAFTATPAQAAVTDYGMQGRAYGSFLELGPTGIESEKTGHSWIGCTRKTGKKRLRSAAAVDAPTGSSFLSVGAVKSSTRTIRNLDRGIVAGSLSRNKVAAVVLGETSGPHLTIKGLSTQAKAWANKSGKLRAAAKFNAVKIESKTGTPLDLVLNQANDPLDALTNEITGGANNVLVIPKLGEIKLGRTKVRRAKNFARTDALALRILAYGEDETARTTDDVRIRVGHSKAKITRGLTSGVLGGNARAVDARLLGGIGRARLAEQPLQCHGTNGVWDRESAVGGDLFKAGIIDVHAASTKVRGEQNRRTATANTLGRVAKVAVGGKQGLVIDTIVGRVNVHKKRTGKVKTNFKGSKLGSISVAGEQTEASDVPKTLEIPGVGLIKVEFDVKNKSRRGGNIIAARITLLEEGPQAGSVINLGVARAQIRNR